MGFRSIVFEYRYFSSNIRVERTIFVTKDIGILSNLIQSIEKQNTICTADQLKKVFHLTLLD